ncbi:MAG TPA: (2Fe-2S)-binding protein [Nitrososphaerales archaeon]|nr:(2Fe-2S)-binding protein [Nitrososphaerales archaeon]
MLVRLRVNGRDFRVDAKGNERLLDSLRRLGMKSVKEGCSVGDCGSCNVIVDGRLVNSCMMLAIQARGSEVTTCEGLGSLESLQPLQKAFVDAGVPQCGYCIPGVLMTAKYYLDNHSRPRVEEIRDILEGNICRCGAYTKITQAILAASNQPKRRL